MKISLKRGWGLSTLSPWTNFGLTALALVAATINPAFSGSTKPIVVGIFDLAPLCRIHQGQPQGMFISLVEKIAKEENWSVQYLRDDLDQLKAHLEAGAIDLLVGAPHDRRISNRCDYSRETIISTWGQVYASRPVEIQTILDLAALNVGVVPGDPYAAELRQVVRRLNIQCRFVEFKQYSDVVEALASGWIDAGVLDRIFGAGREQTDGITKTPIIFAPVELRFSVPKGDHRQLLAAVDYHLNRFKQNPDSVYHRFLRDAFGKPENAALVSVLRLGVGILAGFLFLSLAAGMVLRHQVKARTLELTQKNSELAQELAQRRMAESAGRRSEAERLRLATIIEQSSESIFLMDTGRIIEYVNPAFEAMSGYERKEAIGRTPDFLYSDTHDRDTLWGMNECIGTGRVWTGRVSNLKKDGSRFVAETKISPLRDPGGNVTGFVNIKRDVTFEVQLGDQLRQAQKLQAIGRLAGGIAHDFNNILAGIMGFTELAQIQANGDKKFIRYTKEILSGCQRARDLVRQILTFSRHQKPEKKPLRFRAVLEEALKLVKATIPSSIEIRTDFLAGKAFVSADPTQIHQMIINLCTNAAHAMADGGGVLRVELATTGIDPETSPRVAGLRQGTQLRLTISDTGHGMGKEVMERLFDPFFTTKEMGQGTGLGLSVVHGIVKSHGGAIDVESVPGKGSAFIVYLPVIDEVASGESLPAPRPRGGRETILVVDDEPAIGAIAEESLGSLGYAVVPTTSSTEALKWVESDPARFDLVITDRTMPALSGIELSRKIKKIRKDLPIIMCTGLADTRLEPLARAAGIGECLVKPLERASLASAVRRVLEKADAATM